jgi:hypothetical protein
MVIIVSSNCVYYDENRECLSELFLFTLSTLGQVSLMQNRNHYVQASAIKVIVNRRFWNKLLL